MCVSELWNKSSAWREEVITIRACACFLEVQEFKELCGRTKKLKLPEWQQEYTPERLVLKLFVSPLLISKFEVIMEGNFHFTCAVNGRAISNHSVYEANKRFLKNITLSELIQKLAQYCLCDGISEQKGGCVHHAIPCHAIIDQEIQVFICSSYENDNVP